MSFTASYVIFFILLARLALQKAPKIFSYALWGVALFRLICPWSFASVWSLLGIGGGALDRLRSSLGFASNPSTVSSLPPGPVPSREGGGSSLVSSFGSLDLGSPDLAQTPSLPVSAPFSQTWVESGLTILWLVGMGVLLLVSLIRLFKLQHQLKGAVCERDTIYRSNTLSTPFVMGVIHPKIYLPAFLSGAEKEYILLHEQTHIRRFDHVIKLLSFIALCFHWFNPLVWVAFFLSAKDMEMSCDEAVIKTLGHGVKKDYTTSLLSLAAGRRIVGGTPLAFGEGDTRGRIEHVLNYKKPVFWVIILALIAVTILGAGLLANPIDRSDSANRLRLSPEVTAIAMEQFKNHENVGRVEIIDPALIPEIIDSLNEVKKTLHSSVNDAPLAENYLSLELMGSEYTKAYLYEEGGKYYLELPYTGIYSCSREVGEYIAAVYDKGLQQGGLLGATPASAGGLTFSLPHEDWDPTVFGEAAFRTWINTYMGENVRAEERIADYWIKSVKVITGDWEKVKDAAYQYVVQVNYGITTASEEYLAPADGISGKGRFDSVFRELCVKDLGNDQYDIISVGTGGGEQVFAEAADPLETAVSKAILEHNMSVYKAGEFATEAHTTLAVRENEAAFGAGTVTVYAMALYLEFDYNDGGLQEGGGNHMPVAITFQVEPDSSQHPGSSSIYKVVDYWVPKDGAYYGPSIKDRFPAKIVEAAMDTQIYIKAHVIACYDQAVAHGNLDPKPNLERLIKTISSSPTWASNPYAYIEAHPLDYRTLVYYGDYTLDYAFDRFAKGGERGVEGQIMAAACRDIMMAKGASFDDIAYNTGQDWYDSIKASLRR